MITIPWYAVVGITMISVSLLVHYPTTYQIQSLATAKGSVSRVTMDAWGYSCLLKMCHSVQTSLRRHFRLTRDTLRKFLF